MSHNLNSENSQRFALIMKGGGAKGLAYLGAIQVLVHHFEFNWFVGTSAGAVTAVLLAAGYSVDRLIPLVRSKNFKDFMDLRFRDILGNFIIEKGIYRGDELERWVEETLYNELHVGADDNPIRLEQLHINNKNRFTVYASTKYDNAKDYDSHDEETKRKKAKRVVRLSASIPFFFTRVYDEDGAVFDGGLSHNYPISVFLEKYNEDKTLKFLGLYLGRKPGSPKTTNHSVVSDLLDRWLSGNDKTGLTKYETQTVVIDPFPVTTLRFNLTEDEKDFLLATGRASALHDLRYQLHVANPPSEKEVNDAIDFAEKLRAKLIPIFNRRKWKRRLIALCLALLFGLTSYVVIKYVATHLFHPSVYEYWTRDKTTGGVPTVVFRHQFESLEECKRSEQNQKSKENEFDHFLLDGFGCTDQKPLVDTLRKRCAGDDQTACLIVQRMEEE
jgi:predicted acylesterase/phospholipase RssA